LSFVADKLMILDGRATILKTSQSGDVWQFRMYVAEEGKHYRKSLKTRDKLTAIQRGTDEALKIYSDIRSGRKIFSSTIGELIDFYVEHRSRDVGVGDITAGRLTTIKSQLAHLAKILGREKRVTELDRDSLYDWYVTRKERNPTVQKVTVRNEQATINHLCEHAYQKGLIHFPKFNFRVLRIRQADIGKRDAFTLEEYDALCGFMRQWVAKKNNEDDQKRNQRLMIRDYVLLSSNTMLRVGELRQLRWNDVNYKLKPTKSQNGEMISLVEIRVRAETSKVRAQREVISRGGNYFERLAANSLSTDGDSLIFSYNGNVPIPDRDWAKYWDELMTGIGIDDWQTRKLTWYSLRHFGITLRIRAGVDIVSLSKIAGTSVHHIENTYLKYSRDMSISAALKNFTVSKEGISTFD